MKAIDPTLAAALEALDRGDTRRARALVKRSEEAARRQKAERRETRLFQRLTWPKCGAPRADGQPCEARGLWLPGEDSPRTRCRHHGGAQSPNAPRVRPTSATERPSTDERAAEPPAGAGEAPARSRGGASGTDKRQQESSGARERRRSRHGV